MSHIGTFTGHKKYDCTQPMNTVGLGLGLCQNVFCGFVAQEVNHDDVFWVMSDWAYDLNGVTKWMI